MLVLKIYLMGFYKEEKAIYTWMWFL